MELIHHTSSWWHDQGQEITLSAEFFLCTRAVWKVRGLALLLRFGTLWRCGDGLFFEVPPLANDAFLTTPHPLLENVLQTVCRKLQEDSGTGVTLPAEGFMRNFFGGGESLCFQTDDCCLVSGSQVLTEHRIQSRKADAVLRKYLVALPS
jgi:hypothetical protein